MPDSLRINDRDGQGLHEQSEVGKRKKSLIGLGWGLCMGKRMVEDKTGEDDGRPFGMCSPVVRQGHLPRLCQPGDVQSPSFMQAVWRSCAEWIRLRKTGLHSIVL